MSGSRRRVVVGGIATLLVLVTAACRVPFDFDDDNKADPVVVVGRDWFVAGEATPFFTQPTGDVHEGAPVAGDYDGDGVWEPAWIEGDDWITTGAAGTLTFAPPRGVGEDWYGWRYNEARGMVVPADYDGDGTTDPAYYDNLTGTWHIEGLAPVLHGPAEPSDRNESVFSGQYVLPVPADYDGDGADDPAYFRPIDGTWHILGEASPRSLGRTPLGYVDLPAPADYDGDVRAEIALVRRPEDVTGVSRFLVEDQAPATLPTPEGYQEECDWLSFPRPAKYTAGNGADELAVQWIAVEWGLGTPTCGAHDVFVTHDGQSLETSANDSLPPGASAAAQSYLDLVNLAQDRMYCAEVRPADDGCNMTVPTLVHPPGDVDGDRLAEPLIVRADGLWWIAGEPSPLHADPTWPATPVLGDYDGDGLDEPAALITDTWTTTTTTITYPPPRGTGQQWWAGGATPGIRGDAVPADWNGDGTTDPAYYDHLTGTWHIHDQPDIAFGPAEPADPTTATLTGTYVIPLPADTDGDGDADPTYYRPIDGTWHRPDHPPLTIGHPRNCSTPAPAESNSQWTGGAARLFVASQATTDYEWWTSTETLDDWPVGTAGPCRLDALLVPAPGYYDGVESAAGLVVNLFTGATAYVGDSSRLAPAISVPADAWPALTPPSVRAGFSPIVTTAAELRHCDTDPGTCALTGP